MLMPSRFASGMRYVLKTSSTKNEAEDVYALSLCSGHEICSKGRQRGEVSQQNIINKYKDMKSANVQADFPFGIANVKINQK